MIVREFSISYFSEVSAVLILTDDYKLKATHPTENVGIECWFHFNGTPPSTDPLVISGNSVDKMLAKMADELYPGADHILSLDDTVDDTREQFFTDFFISFSIGHYHYQSTEGPKNYTHSAGPWLESLS